MPGNWKNAFSAIIQRNIRKMCILQKFSSGDSQKGFQVKFSAGDHPKQLLRQNFIHKTRKRPSEPKFKFGNSQNVISAKTQDS